MHKLLLTIVARRSKFRTMPKKTFERLLPTLVKYRHCCKCNVKLTTNIVSRAAIKCGHNICRTCRNHDDRMSKLRVKAATMLVYGGKCVCCGETNLVFLTIDHIDEMGSAHRKTFRNSGAGSNLYSWLKKQGYPKDNYQILCFNCNFAKHVLGTCPHQNK